MMAGRWIAPLGVVASAIVARAQSAPVRDADPCASCRYRESAEAYRAASARVVGEWRTYYVAMAEYQGCMAQSLRADTGRCAEPPRQPASSPCASAAAMGLAICNATLPPERPGATFVAVPDSLTPIDLKQTTYTAAGAVRYVWDALRARQELAPATRSRDQEAVRVRRHTTDSLLAAIARAARPPPNEEPAFRAAIDAGIERMNRAAISDDPDEYLDALRFVAFADSVHPSPQAKFVLGLITYQIGEHALLAAWQIHNCSVVLLASDALMQSDRYLGQNAVVAPENAMRLRASLSLMQHDATELVTRRCMP